MDPNCTCSTTSTGGEEWSYGDIFSAALNCIQAIVIAGLAYRLSSVKTHNVHSVTARSTVVKKGDETKETRHVEARIVASTESKQTSLVINGKKAAAAGKEESDIAGGDEKAIAAVPPTAIRNAAVRHAVKSAMKAVGNPTEAGRDAAIVDLVSATYHPSHEGTRSLLTDAARKIGHVRKMSIPSAEVAGATAPIDKRAADEGDDEGDIEEGRGAEDAGAGALTGRNRMSDDATGGESEGGAKESSLTGIDALLSAMARDGTIDGIIAKAPPASEEDDASRIPSGSEDEGHETTAQASGVDVEGGSGAELLRAASDDHADEKDRGTELAGDVGHTDEA